MAFAAARAVSVITPTVLPTLQLAAPRCTGPRGLSAPRALAPISRRRRTLVALASTSGGDWSKGAVGYCVSIKVGGMVCDGCSTRVEEALKAAPGVTSAEVSLEKGTAEVTLSAADEPEPTAAIGKLKKIVADLGFEASAAEYGLQ